jgi:hypothetical protein
MGLPTTLPVASKRFAKIVKAWMANSRCTGMKIALANEKPIKRDKTEFTGTIL